MDVNVLSYHLNMLIVGNIQSFAVTKQVIDVIGVNMTSPYLTRRVLSISEIKSKL